MKMLKKEECVSSQNLLAACISASKAAKGWWYSRPFSRGPLEIAIVRGQQVALPSHFHDEDQLTFVLSGRRRFTLCGKLIEVPSGRGVCIPAGVAHSSFDETSEVRCINLYLPAGCYDAPQLIARLGFLQRSNGELPWDDLISVLEWATEATTIVPEAARHVTVMPQGESVQEAARLLGMSREGFSRWFKRQHGITPQGYKVLERLNEARRLLRAGTAISAAAAQAGFADQSHLGRLFRRSFGVTPKQYLCGS